MEALYRVIEGKETKVAEKPTLEKSTFTMSIIKNIFKTKERRALEAYELVNGDGGLTDKGRAEFVDYLWEKSDDAREAFIAEVVKYSEEEKGKK